MNTPRTPLWRKTLRLVGYLLLALVLITAVDIYRWPDSRGLAHASFTTTRGEALDLHHTGKPVFLYFWGSWCGICRYTSPQVQSLKNAGYPVASIAIGSGSDAGIHAYLQKHGWNFPVINDDSGELQTAFGIAAVPTIAIVQDGRIRLATSGWSSAWGLRARYHLARLFPAAN
ncbi:MAG: protein disulfide oxidoreductase [Cardiobacteriaceae bacterium]|nr:protein disulfide oxidoreductase [Cardiobacteriaceae bacterium]